MPPDTNGYARSKFLSDLLCEAAVRQLGIPVTVARVGQVAGAVRLQGGEWHRKEWFPSLILGSLSMGCLPDNLGPQFSEIDWIPVDLLAHVLVDLFNDQEDSESEETGKVRVYNLRNPQTTTWEPLLPSIIDTTKTFLGPDRVLGVVPPFMWLERLDDAVSKETGEGAITNPAVTLLEFYRNYLWGLSGQAVGKPQKAPPMSVEQASAHSAGLRDLEAVRPEWVQKWISEWMK